MKGARPLIVGIGGSLRRRSSSEFALRACLGFAAQMGAEVECFAGGDLALPHYSPDVGSRTEMCRRYLDAVRRADGFAISAPGYHGALSGMVKNALDYVQDLSEDDRPYFHDRAVACVACAAGPQAGVGTLVSLRAVVHSLRGWPTPLGVVVSSEKANFDAAGGIQDATLATQLRTATEQVLAFASLTAGSRTTEV